MKILFSVYLTIVLLDVSLSASVIPFETAHEAYSVFLNSKLYGIHIPLLLNMNQKERKDVCENLLRSSAMEREGVVTVNPDDIPNKNVIIKPELDLKSYITKENERNRLMYPVRVQNVIRIDEVTEGTLPELMIECVMLIRTKTQSEMHTLFAASTFQPGTLFWGALNPKGVQIAGIADLSPTSVPFEQRDLERYYLDHRLPVEKLRKQWPQMVDLMETQDPFSLLPIAEETRLCLSLFESDFYRQTSTTYKYKKYTRESENKYEVARLAFRTSEMYSEQLVTKNIICHGEQNGNIDSFFVTRSYNDENSVFVQRMHNGILFLETYIKDIPILMHVTADSTSFSSSDFETSRQRAFPKNKSLVV